MPTPFSINERLWLVKGPGNISPPILGGGCLLLSDTPSINAQCSSLEHLFPEVFS